LFALWSPDGDVVDICS